MSEPSMTRDLDGLGDYNEAGESSDLFPEDSSDDMADDLDLSDYNTDSDEGFCSYMCPPGDDACTKEQCMETIKQSKLKPVAPKGQTAQGSDKPPAVVPGQGVPSVNSPMNAPTPANNNCVQSGCCVKRGNCKPNCMTTRDACL